MPDIGQGERHQRYIRQNIRDRISEEKFLAVDVAYRRLGPIPETGHRFTLEECHKDLNR